VFSLSTLGVEITSGAISVVTLLMVFVPQNTQDRDSAATHLKLDEVVRVEPDARDPSSEPRSDPRRRSKNSTRTSTSESVPGRAA
jgi:Low affinity iron permease